MKHFLIKYALICIHFQNRNLNIVSFFYILKFFLQKRFWIEKMCLAIKCINNANEQNLQNIDSYS